MYFISFLQLVNCSEEMEGLVTMDANFQDYFWFWISFFKWLKIALSVFIFNTFKINIEIKNYMYVNFHLENVPE